MEMRPGTTPVVTTDAGAKILSSSGADLFSRSVEDGRERTR
jgi:hypothetical protein